jgi:hypothetical protein
MPQVRTCARARRPTTTRSRQRTRWRSSGRATRTLCRCVRWCRGQRSPWNGRDDVSRQRLWVHMHVHVGHPRVRGLHPGRLRRHTSGAAPHRDRRRCQSCAAAACLQTVCSCLRARRTAAQLDRENERRESSARAEGGCELAARSGANAFHRWGGQSQEGKEPRRQPPRERQPQLTQRQQRHGRGEPLRGGERARRMAHRGEHARSRRMTMAWTATRTPSWAPSVDGEELAGSCACANCGHTQRGTQIPRRHVTAGRQGALPCHGLLRGAASCVQHRAL